MGKKEDRLNKRKAADPLVRAELLEKRKLKRAKKLLRRQNIRKAIEIRNNSLRPIDWPSLNLPPPRKDIYQEYVKISNLSPTDVERYRKEMRITVKGTAPNPITSFQEICLPDFCRKEILQNFKEPTPVQAQTWPIAISGHNMVCIANDDKGKNLAYLLPAILHILAQPPLKRGEGSTVLILSPNNQSIEIVKKVVGEYTSKSGIRSMCALTGVSLKKQTEEIARGHHIIIGNPVRVVDLLIDGHLSLKMCTFIVLNEVDRMSGSEHQVKRILGQTRPDCQILMFVSAKFKGMDSLVGEFFGNHIEVNVEPRELALSYVITQHVDVIIENYKGPKLKEVLLQIDASEYPRGKIMIFVATNRRVDKVRKFITSFSKSCSAIHFDKNNVERAKLLKEFQTGKNNILITTDSFGRDIIVNRIRYVINFDHPLDHKDYLRRLSRIDPGIAGHSFTFFTRRDALSAQHLIDVLRKTKQFVSGDLLYMAKVGSDPAKNGVPKYYPRTKSGLIVEKKNRPTAFGKADGANGSDDEGDSDSDADDAVPAESADDGFDNKINDVEFGSSGCGSGSYMSRNRTHSDADICIRRDDNGFRTGGIRAGGGAGFGSDIGGFPGNRSGGVSGIGYESGTSSFVGSGNQFSFGGGNGGIRAGNVLGLGNQGGGVHVGGGTGFGNMRDDSRFRIRVGGSGFVSQGDKDLLGAGFGNIDNFGRDDGVSFRNTACVGSGIGIGNGRGFGIDDGEKVSEHCSRGDESRFNNVGGDRNVGWGTGYQKRDGDSVANRINFAAERNSDNHGDHEFNKRSDEYFSKNFGVYGGSGEIGDERFNREINDNFGRIGTNNNYGGRGDDCYSQGNGNFAGRGSDRARGFGFSDGFANRDNSNFRDARDNGGFPNKDDHFNGGKNVTFNNPSDSKLNRREDLSSSQDALFTRRDVRHFNNTSRWVGYSGGHESNRNRPYNPHSGGAHGRNSGYDR